MQILPFQHKIRFIITILFFVSAAGYFFSAGFASNPEEEEQLTGLMKQARIYRQQGFELQSIGNMEEALVFYQKAVEADPRYAVAFNDLGVIYESQGQNERAKEGYLRAIEVDPMFLGAYSNLALLFENERNLEKAIFYWNKRAELGSPEDPWTKKARMRLEDIKLVFSEKPMEDLREQSVLELMQDVTAQKYILKQNDAALAKKHFDRAKMSYNKQDYATAIKEALDAQQLDPSNPEIDEFIEKTQRRALSQ